MNVSGESLLSNRSFVFVLVAGLCAMLGFSMFFLSVSWFIVDVLREPAVLGVVLMSMSIPRVIMMIYGGVLADKVRKSLIMFVTNLLQVGVMSAMIVLFVNDWLGITSLITIAIAFGFLDAFFFPAVSSMIPVIVKDELLQQANSLFQGATELMFILGPLVAGGLLTVGDFTLTFSAAALLIFLSAVFVFPPLIQDPKSAGAGVTNSALQDLKIGLNYVRRSTVHMTGTLSIVVINLFLLGPMLMSFPILVEALGGGPFELSLLEGGLSLGTFSASICIVSLNLRKKRGRFVFGSLLLCFVLFISFSQAEMFPLLVILAALTGFVGMFVYLPTVTIVQEHTDKDKLGRVMSIITLAASGFEPVAFGLISMIVAAAIPIQTVLAMLGTVGFMLSLLLVWKSKHFLKLD